MNYQWKQRAVGDGAIDGQSDRGPAHNCRRLWVGSIKDARRVGFSLQGRYSLSGRDRLY